MYCREFFRAIVFNISENRQQKIENRLQKTDYRTQTTEL